MVLELCNEWYSPDPPHFVGAMKIARNVAVSGRLVEWWNVPTSEFRRGDENRPPTSRFPGGMLNGMHPPAPSLRELSSECETEGVYPDERKRSKISEPK